MPIICELSFEGQTTRAVSRVLAYNKRPISSVFRVTSGCGFESPAGQLKIAISLSNVFRMLNQGPV